ncbi:amidohydrolase [Plectosphaerella plurivora]|uniref:Peptidase M20 domain-containing protein 2 n=1 Tax=Plectosphaerella plurivora TaxID=936078 RepID=A0A9P8V4F5_9PEZI|nr:amidohydrolase [Plectosphaerella plurivora]
MATLTLTSTAEDAIAITAEDRISDTIDSYDKQLREISLKIHDDPELCFVEYRAHDNIVALLQSLGITVTPHAYGLETSFSAEYGSGGRVVTFCCEYDALPQIGHGCGHNLIATCTIAAFLGTVSALKQSGGPGRVRLLGTPAEEGGGGKIKLIDAGAFKDVDASLMSHPFPVSPATRGTSGIAYGNCLAVLAFRATFEGRAAHAAFSPWLGANALDAVTLTYTAVGMLRQQTRPTDIIGLIIENGGASSNIIPERSVMSCNVRAKTLREAKELLDRVHKCLEGAALATGCTVKIETIHDPYADLRSNETLCSVFTETMTAFQKTYKCDLNNMQDGPYGTDMGNVSYVCPSFHGTFHIETPPGVALHSAEFAAAARTQENHEITVQVAKGMAQTAWKVLSDEAVAKWMKDDFERDLLLR